MYIFTAQDAAVGRADNLSIQVIEGNWGDWGPVRTDYVYILFERVARTFLKPFDNLIAVDVTIECRPDRPNGQVAPVGNAPGKHLVTLVTQNFMGWCFQLAHELCHIVSGYENLISLSNKWFHETLCDVAVVYTLRQMARNNDVLPIPNGVPLTRQLSEYPEWIVRNPDYQLPKSITFLEWFRQEEGSLRFSPFQRNKNRLMALQLLPLFERNPIYWRSVCSIPDSGEPFLDFLKEWKELCPEPQKQCVTEIMVIFGYP